MGKNKDGLVRKSDVVKKLQEHVGVPAKVWAGMLIRWLDEIEDFEMPEIIRCKDCKHGRPYKHTKEYVSCEVDCEPIDRDSDFFCADGKRRE